MKIKSISITEAQYGPNKGNFEAKIQLAGGSSYPADINIGIPPEALEPIVQIIQHAVVESMARSAEEFRSSVAASLAGPVIDAQAIEAPVAPLEEEDIPL